MKKTNKKLTVTWAVHCGAALQAQTLPGMFACDVYPDYTQKHTWLHWIHLLASEVTFHTSLFWRTFINPVKSDTLIAFHASTVSYKCEVFIVSRLAGVCAVCLGNAGEQNAQHSCVITNASARYFKTHIHGKFCQLHQKYTQRDVFMSNHEKG